MRNSYVNRSIPSEGDMDLYIAVSTTGAISMSIVFIISNQFPPYFLHYVVNLFENVFCKTIAFMILWLQIMLQSALDT
jgi:cation transport ATPase